MAKPEEKAASRQGASEPRDKSGALARAWFEAAVGAAVIGGAFSLIVATLLVVGHVRGRLSDPRDSQELNVLGAELLRKARDEGLKKTIRELDLRLREEYFRRRAFAERGTYLLLGGLVVFLVGLRYAFVLREKLPHPKPGGRGEEERASALARRSVAVLGALLACAALFLAMTAGSVRTETPAEGEAAPALAVEPPFPSREETERNWPRFRGPGGQGISAYADAPARWNGAAGEGILWKTQVPLPGQNSPVVWGRRVFLTGATEEKREVYCFDADSGAILWRARVEGIPRARAEPPEVEETTGYAAPTAAADGRRVCAVFANGDLICFDFSGKRLWARNLGTPENAYGHASSLVIHRNLLLVLFDQGSGEEEESELLALDVSTGRTVWRAARPVPNSWATPIVIHAGEGEQIVTCGDPWVIAYDPSTGTELWRAECISGDIAPSPVYAGGLVFAVNTGSQLAAIRPEGRGDVSETHVLWTAWEGLPDTCSPLADGGSVFTLTSSGKLTCYRAGDGNMLWAKDFETAFSSSPSLAGGRLYLTSEEGVTFMVEAGAEHRELGRAELGERACASFAFADGRIYARGEKHLFCIGRK